MEKIGGNASCNSFLSRLAQQKCIWQWPLQKTDFTVEWDQKFWSDRFEGHMRDTFDKACKKYLSLKNKKTPHETTMAQLVCNFSLFSLSRIFQIFHLNLYDVFNLLEWHGLSTNYPAVQSAFGSKPKALHLDNKYISHKDKNTYNKKVTNIYHTKVKFFISILISVWPGSPKPFLQVPSFLLNSLRVKSLLAD